jgi:hypothetical protein
LTIPWFSVALVCALGWVGFEVVWPDTPWILYVASEVKKELSLVLGRVRCLAHAVFRFVFGQSIRQRTADIGTQNNFFCGVPRA